MKKSFKKFLQIDVGSGSFWILLFLVVALAVLLPMAPSLRNNQVITRLVPQLLVLIPIGVLLIFLGGSLAQLRILRGSAPYASRGTMSLTETVHVLVLGSILFMFMVFSGYDADDYLTYFPFGIYIIHATILVSIPTDSTFLLRRIIVYIFLLGISFWMFLLFKDGSGPDEYELLMALPGLALGVGILVFSIPSSGLGTFPIALIYLACMTALHGAFFIPPVILFLPVAALYFPFHRRLLEMWRPRPLPPISRFNVGPTRGLSRQSKSGITLIELLIVVAIVAIAVPMLVHISSMIMRAQARAEDRTAALALAQDQFALLRAGEGAFSIGENPIDSLLAENNPLAVNASYVIESTTTPGLYTVQFFLPFDPGEQALGVHIATQIYRPQAGGGATQ